MGKDVLKALMDEQNESRAKKDGRRMGSEGRLEKTQFDKIFINTVGRSSAIEKTVSDCMEDFALWPEEFRDKAFELPDILKDRLKVEEGLAFDNKDVFHKILG
jgi:hypothetical protein